MTLAPSCGLPANSALQGRNTTSYIEKGIVESNIRGFESRHASGKPLEPREGQDRQRNSEGGGACRDKKIAETLLRELVENLDNEDVVYQMSTKKEVSRSSVELANNVCTALSRTETEEGPTQPLLADLSQYAWSNLGNDFRSKTTDYSHATDTRDESGVLKSVRRSLHKRGFRSCGHNFIIIPREEAGVEKSTSVLAIPNSNASSDILSSEAARSSAIASEILREHAISGTYKKRRPMRNSGNKENRRTGRDLRETHDSKKREANHVDVNQHSQGPFNEGESYQVGNGPKSDFATTLSHSAKEKTASPGFSERKDLKNSLAYLQKPSEAYSAENMPDISDIPDAEELIQQALGGNKIGPFQ